MMPASEEITKLEAKMKEATEAAFGSVLEITRTSKPFALQIADLQDVGAEMIALYAEADANLLCCASDEVLALAYQKLYHRINAIKIELARRSSES